MSIDLIDPTRHQLMGKKEDNDIREIFYQHWEEMKNQIKKTIDGINDWRSECIQHTNSYADAQIRILEVDYKQQRAIFDQKREENIELAKAYHKKKQNELFEQLRNACQSLRFQLAQLEYVHVQNESVRPQVITVAELTRKWEQTNTNRHASQYGNANSRPIITSTSSNVNNQSTSSNNNNSTTSTTIHDDSYSKCPICFMIFPLAMKREDRHRHVDEHMLDGQGTHNLIT